MSSDEELYRQLQRGELGAFDELYRRYERRLFGFILAQLADRAEAEDVLHDAFMAMLREPRSREVSNFRAFIFQVARHLCLNRIRAQKRADRALAPLHSNAAYPRPLGTDGSHIEPRGVAVPGGAAALHPENIALAREAPEALRRAVASLPAPLAQVYELRAAGHSYQQMAGILGVPLGTVKSRMNEMVARLKKEMVPWTAR
jgi:RNA polymerase sigma-70 factor (ECF subfamily)